MKKYFIFLVIMLFTITCFAGLPPQNKDFTFNDVSFGKPDANKNVLVSGKMVNNTATNFDTILLTISFTDDNEDLIQKLGITMKNVAGNSTNDFQFICNVPANSKHYRLDGEITGNKDVTTLPNNPPTNSSTTAIDPQQFANLVTGLLSAPPQTPQDFVNILTNFFPRR